MLIPARPENGWIHVKSTHELRRDVKQKKRYEGVTNYQNGKQARAKKPLYFHLVDNNTSNAAPEKNYHAPACSIPIPVSPKNNNLYCLQCYNEQIEKHLRGIGAMNHYELGSALYGSAK